MNSFHLEWIHSILEWFHSTLERIRSRCFWNLISSPILKIRGWLCEFIAEGIISLAFLIKKLLTFMMIWEITLEWFHSIVEWFRSTMEGIHSNLIIYDSRIHSKIRNIEMRHLTHLNIIVLEQLKVFLIFGLFQFFFLLWNEFIPGWNDFVPPWNEIIPSWNEFSPK